MRFNEKMSVQNKMVYVTPIVEVIEVEVEKGFAMSDPYGSADDFPWGN